MISSISSVQSSYSAFYQSTKVSSSSTALQDTSSVSDILDFGQSGPLSTKDAIALVNERTMNKLRGVISEARAELGLSEDSTMDFSPEATANRIADFALNFFGNYQQNHPELSGDEAKKQFAEYIGGAINQGIDEARGILSALSVMNSDVDNHINTISSIIQDRLNAFVSGSDEG